MRNEGDTRAQVHTFSRRAFIPLLGLGLAGCAAPTIDIPSPTVLPTRTPSSKPSADNRASQAPKTLSPETLKLVEARGVFLDSWLHLLSSTQVDGLRSLTMQIQNFDVWKNYFEGLRNDQPVPPPSDSLSVRWLGKTRYFQNGVYRGSKYVGEMQFKEIKLNAGKYALSPIDQENDKDKGITWRGAASISFWRKWREYIISTTNGTSEAKVITWLDEPVKLDQNFTDWSPEQIQRELVFKKGSWDPVKFRLPDPGGSPTYKEFDLPSTALMEDVNYAVCVNESSQRPCRKITTELK